jgi:hypothetical protein
MRFFKKKLHCALFRKISIKEKLSPYLCRIIFPMAFLLSKEYAA